MHIFQVDVFGFHIAPTWYGFMYAASFIFCYSFFRKYSSYSRKELEDIWVWIFLWVILGWRIGYIVLYNLGYFINHPIEIFSIWKGGMSFHGGFLGVLVAVFCYQKIHKKRFFDFMDILAICIPVGLGLGRIGNYINGELLGFSPYNGPLKILENGISHFPSTLLEMFLEGVVLFSILYGTFLMQKQRKIGTGMYSSIFLIGYGLARIISELVRLPDAQIGYLFGTHSITIGMIYTLPFLIAGSILFVRARGISESQVS
jgi:phosphatidylglycerol:prolipoprotein diacylglycerol transferase